MIRRKVDLPQSYITEKSAEYSDLIREKKQIRGPLWPDHNSRDVKIEFTKHSQKLTYTCRVSQTQNTLFCSNPESYLLYAHAPFSKKLQKTTTNSITSSVLIPRDNGRRQFFVFMIIFVTILDSI